MIRKISAVCASVKNKTKLVRKRSLHRLKIFLKYLLKKEEKEPVFIITTRRTGSNLLLGYLNSIPKVSFAPEILNQSMSYGIRGRFISKKAVLRHIAHSINACEHKICGAKFVRTHLERHGVTLEDLKEHFPTARFIILYRRSMLDQLVSLKIAEATNTWHWTAQFHLPSSIVIEIPALLEYCKEMRRFYRDTFRNDGWLERSITLSYEELVQSPQETFEQKVFPFLKLPPSKVTSAAKKQNTKDLRKIVQNYTDLLPWIGHPSMLQDYSSSSDGQNALVLESAAMAG